MMKFDVYSPRLHYGKNSEKRKEKSRDAARCRRSKESEIFSDLSSQLPLPQGTAATLDKTSVMRLTVGYLKVREMVELFIAPYNHKCRLAISEKLAPKEHDMFKQLDGFFLVLSEEGDVIHLSENVEQFIGIPQVEMLGQSVFEFSHPCDHDEIRAILTAKVPVNGKSPTTEKDFFSIFVRMKSTIKTKGRAVNLKSATYQVIHYNGHKMGIPKWLATDKCSTVMVLIFGKPVPHPAQIDMPLDTDIFISRHSPDMKFTHIDERITDFLGYKSSELIGKSVYSYYHALDVIPLLEAFKTTSIVSQSLWRRKNSCWIRQVSLTGRWDGRKQIDSLLLFIRTIEENKNLKSTNTIFKNGFFSPLQVFSFKENSSKFRSFFTVSFQIPRDSIAPRIKFLSSRDKEEKKGRIYFPGCKIRGSPSNRKTVSPNEIALLWGSPGDRPRDRYLSYFSVAPPPTHFRIRLACPECEEDHLSFVSCK
ncbi:hypoxia-inducible factor 1-alpha [Caerostris darwini]|uniref:Hypoxia-inducible factor 1-alpha n=1 Tax=Caerostris darwini TaxID=1538125 RepID=A0AAV4R6N2_9ARAC|nr:hypoxia-inducible factor 1-alpha [Caerostris darwini]